MIGRAMYIWKLEPILAAEGGVAAIVQKARRAKLSAIWVKVAQGDAAYWPNLAGATGTKFKDLINRCHDRGIQVWGWHVPRCATAAQARDEAGNFHDLADDLHLDGLIMDAEGGEGFFLGDVHAAAAYAEGMRTIKQQLGKPLAISSHDIPQNIPGWLAKFNCMAAVADLNFPQVYYGSSPSVLHRLTRAEDANSHLTIPFLPVGAGWIGQNDGGCESASACAERARELHRLVADRKYQGYAFWHWAGAPLALWEMLNRHSV